MSAMGDLEPLLINVDDGDRVPLGSTKYHARLCTLVIREGTKCIRNYTKNNLESNGELHSVLKLETIHNMLRKFHKQRIILPHQYSILYPDDGSCVKEDKIDISLWVTLARNLIRSRSLIEWDKTPSKEDNLNPHHILRIRNARNKLYHMADDDISHGEFEILWKEISCSLLALGASQHDIDALRTAPLDPDLMKLCAYEVKQQAMDEKCTKLEKEVEQRKFFLGGFLLMLFFTIMSCIVIITLIVLYTQNVPCSKYITSIKTNKAWMHVMSRSGWGALSPHRKTMKQFHGPVKYVIISHTAISGNCLTHEECCSAVRFLQEVNMFKDPNQHFDDIAFNYVIGGDGICYEGRANYYTPAICPSYNSRMIAIGFLGLFTDQEPTQDALSAAQIYIQHLVDAGTLTNDTTVLGLCQVYGDKYPISPGIKLMNHIQHWKGNGWSWKPYNVSKCVGMESYGLKDEM